MPKRAYAVGTVCFGKCFLFYAITGRTYFLYWFIVSVRVFSNRYFVAFFETSVLQIVHILHIIYVSYLARDFTFSQ